MKAALSATTLFSFVLAATAANIPLVAEYSGATFFDGWDFYGDTDAGLKGPWNGSHPYDDTTNGDVFYMGRTNGSNLYSVDAGTGHAFIKVDNTSVVPYDQKRDSIRITTKDSFNIGTVWVVDVYHLPWGCSVWPGIWTSGQKWPDQGEIDIVEGVNKMTYNQMALHTLSGCTAAPNSGQSGKPGGTDCSPTSGCTVIENQPASYGPDFNSAGGGVWATYFDTTGVFIWFWPRGKVPASVTGATSGIDPSTFGTPSAAYPSSTCEIDKFFGAQNLIIDITLCGDWGKNPNVYDNTCNDTPQVPVTNPPTDPAARCYLDNVINNGTSDYANAFFEIGSVRAYSTNFSAAPAEPSGAAPSGSAPVTIVQTSTGANGAPITVTVTSHAGSATDTAGAQAGKNAASMLGVNVVAPFTGAVTLLAWLLL